MQGSNQFLLSAKVDKIQSFIFQSARLKEVIGGSYMLMQFGKDLEEHLGVSSDRIMIRGGGNFQILCGDEDEVIQLGNRLRQAFKDTVGGNIVIHKPLPFPLPDNVQFERQTAPAEPLWHLPYQAICASCGERYAAVYKSNYPDEADNYRCENCTKKAQVATQHRGQLFVSLLDHLHGPDDARDIKHPFDAVQYALDERNYIAYMAADGNSMGDIFRQCNPEQRQSVSEELGHITEKALADAIRSMTQFMNSKALTMLPVLPLIIGGDDLFVLMPPRWAMHVAAIFCEKYQDLMSQFLSKTLDKDIVATTGVSVVICKASYPFKAAHRHAEELLDTVKDTAKGRGASMLSVDFIIGNDAVAASSRYRPHIYTPEEAYKLLEIRLLQNRLSQTRRARIRNAIYQLVFDGNLGYLDESDNKWLDERHQRDGLHEDTFLDLLNLWDFLLDLNEPLSRYMEVERL